MQWTKPRRWLPRSRKAPRKPCRTRRKPRSSNEAKNIHRRCGAEKLQRFSFVDASFRTGRVGFAGVSADQSGFYFYGGDFVTLSFDAIAWMHVGVHGTGNTRTGGIYKGVARAAPGLCSGRGGAFRPICRKGPMEQGLRQRWLKSLIGLSDAGSGGGCLESAVACVRAWQVRSSGGVAHEEARKPEE